MNAAQNPKTPTPFGTRLCRLPTETRFFDFLLMGRADTREDLMNECDNSCLGLEMLIQPLKENKKDKLRDIYMFVFLMGPFVVLPTKDLHI